MARGCSARRAFVRETPSRRRFSLAAFFIAAAAFFLPFVTVSCSGQPPTPETGIQAIQSLFGIRYPFLLAVAFLLSVLGVVLGLVRAPRTLLAWVGGIGAAALVIFAFATRRLVARDGQGGYTVQFDPGFYIALLGLVAATVTNAGRSRARPTASGRETDHERDGG
jgi:hypothetical protein